MSKRLYEQLQTAQACQEDYKGQHPTPRRNSKPRWWKSGLFSGEGSHASPVAALVARKEKQNDGSYLVYAELEPGYVIDDVRIFERFPAEGPSHLLSESFAGCDHSHWTGQVTANK